MKKAVDELFKKLDTKGSNFLNNFEKTISDVSKRYRVPEKQLYDYFENYVNSQTVIWQEVELSLIHI